MKVSGSYTLDAPRQEVWEALNDIDVLARVVPGCQRLEQTGENEYEGTLKIGIAAVRGTYSGKIRIVDIQAPSHYKLIANGRSSNGVVDGSGTVDLEEQDGKTLLTYGGDADIGGTLASVGQRLIEGASRQLLNQSLKALAAQIAERADASAAAGAATEETAPPAAQHQVTNGAEDVLVAAPAGATTAEVQTEPLPSGFVPSNIQPPEPPPAQQFERRSVVVPEDEQLKPESVVQGMVADFVQERPWLPWVIVAFLIGYLLGRARN